MWDVVHSAVGTTQLVWLKGSKGFVYTEAQPTGACTSVGGIVSCPMSGPSYTAVKGKTTFNVPDRPQPYVTRLFRFPVTIPFLLNFCFHRHLLFIFSPNTLVPQQPDLFLIFSTNRCTGCACLCPILGGRQSRPLDILNAS